MMDRPAHEAKKKINWIIFAPEVRESGIESSWAGSIYILVKVQRGDLTEREL